MDVKVDITQYPELKKKGAGLAKIGDSYVISVPYWEPDGTKKYATAAVGRDHVVALRAKLTADLQRLDDIEAEMDAADKK